MRILLDTHTLIWYSEASSKLSLTALEIIDNADERYISLASVWEMQIKIALERLDLQASLPLMIQTECEQNDFRLLPITSDHIYRLADLPPIHGDPFDRMLIVQAQHEDLTLVTTDGNISKYAVETAW